LNSLVLAIVLAGPGQGYLAPLEITLVAPKNRIFAGEPLRLTAIWSVTAPIQVMLDRGRVLIDRGGGFQEWHESQPFDERPTVDSYALAPAAPGASHYVVAVGRPRERATIRPGVYVLAMPTPGLYRLKVEYGYGESIVTSNVVEIIVNAPRRRNLELFEDHSRPYPMLVSDLAGQFEERLDRLIDDYSLNPYLARSYVLVMRRKLWRANREAPDGYPVQGEVPALLEQLAKRDLGDSPFDGDRLILLSEFYKRSGRQAEALATLREIRAEIPEW
jgi:hypothetical protein